MVTTSAGLTGSAGLANRTLSSPVLFGPHETNLGDERRFSDRHVAYYERRARGGAGLIVTETASVHPSDWPYERAPLAQDSAAGWGAVVQACRPYGALVVAGLGHSGSQGSSAYSQAPLWAPSGVADIVSREMPMIMEAAEIDELLDAFTTATELAMAADLDGVEVNAGQHALLRQFLSGLTNTRDDAYGTDKALLLREVLGRVRGALGDRILGLRLCCDELAPWAGITPEQAEDTVAAIAGEVDYLVVVRGSAMGVSTTRPDSHTGPGFNIDLCTTMRAAAGGATSVVLQGSVVDPEQAEWALRNEVADLVEMTRAQIADPDLVRKIAGDEHDQVRPCTLTNQKCLVRDNRNPLVSCIAEPSSGYETVEPHPSSTTGTASRVLVVGGGPAGMEAARILALRGHPVHLVERDDRLGGMLDLAAHVSGRTRLRKLRDWLAAEVTRLGVDVATSTTLDPEDLGDEPVILATGSLPGVRDYAVDPGARIVDVTELLQSVRAGRLDDFLPAGEVSVHDPVGDAVGVGVAELLAESGRSTTLITPDQVAGKQLAITGDLADANGRLQRAGVRLRKRSSLREVLERAVLVQDVLTGESTSIDCTTVIHCGHRVPDERITVSGAIPAGDRVAPRTVYEAILEGRRAALALSGVGVPA